MHAIIDFCLDHARMVIFLFFFLLLAGIVSYTSISKESFPDVKIPVMKVSIPCSGISPEDAERLLVKPVEQKLRSIEGVKEITSMAYEGGGMIVVEFLAGYNVDEAKENVKNEVDNAKPDLPSDANDPDVSEINLSLLPVLIVKLSGSIPQRFLYQAARELKDYIEAHVTGVLKAGIIGNREEVIDLEIDAAKIANHNISVQLLQFLAAQNNRLISAGTITTDIGRFPIKVPGLFEDISDIMDVPIWGTQDSVIRIGDIAVVSRAYKDPESFARDRGENAVAIEITKRTGENVIETIKGVRAAVAEVQKKWPDTLKISFAQDQSKKIIDLLTELQNDILLTIFLVMIIIVLSLGWRSALVVSLSVPGSFLAGILFLYLSGYTINMIVLFALIFAVGMLVDGSIIVVEYADRKIDEGIAPKEAYRTAAQRMAWPVITSISTILVVFLPLLFWPGFMGQVMRFLPITLIATLTASIIMALIFVPTLGGLFMHKASRQKEAHETINYEKDDLKKITGVTQYYIRILEWALDRPWKIIGSALGTLVSVISLYCLCGRGVEFFPSVEPETAVVRVQARGNLSVFEKDRLVKEVEAPLLEMKELRSVYSKSGSMRAANAKSGSMDTGATEDEIGSITVEFADWQERRTAEKIIGDIEQRLHVPGVRVVVEKEKKGPPTKPVRIDVTGKSHPQIQKEAIRIRKFLEAFPEVETIQDNQPVSGIEWRLCVNRAEAARFQANITSVGTVVQLVTRGVKIGSFRPDDSPDEMDIMLRFPKNERNIDELDRLQIQTLDGLMPVGNFVERKVGVSLTTLRRCDGLPCIRIEASLTPGALANDVFKAVHTYLEKEPLQKDVSCEFKGEARDQAETAGFLGKAFSIALGLIMVIMLIEFNSFFSTGIVMSAVIMSTVGVFLGLFLRGMPFGVVMGGIGIIGLAGVIVSNNIIFIDTYDHFRDRIKNARERIIRTGAQRLRPVFLTKITVILGLLPMMYGLGIDFLEPSISFGAPSTQWWQQLATCIVSGVIFASVLTLILTPCLLMVRENYRAQRRRKVAV
ncbi:MAG: efflux RND transporter permease subunit [Holosporales bacterium]|jgi:multidrug efflux pump|nr:efflux RND transporter permease subunit [Holosporales bacterium]